MKFQRKKMLLILIVLIFAAEIDAAQLSDSSLTNIDNLCTLYEHSKTINDLFFKRKFDWLVIVNAGNLKKEIKIAEILSDSNKILDNYYLYYNEHRGYYIFLYHMEGGDYTLRSYLLNKMIESATEVTYIFSIDYGQSFSNYYNDSSVDYNKSAAKYYAALITGKGPCENYTNAVNYFKSFWEATKLDVKKELNLRIFYTSIIYHDITIKHVKDYLYSSAEARCDFELRVLNHPKINFTVSDSVRNFTSMLTNFECFNATTQTMGNIIVSNFPYNMSKFRDVITFADSLKINKDCTANNQMWDFMELFCFILNFLNYPYEYNIRTSILEFPTKHFLKPLQVWFDKLISVYENLKSLNENETFLRNLKTEIQTFEKNYKHLMEEAHSTISRRMAQERRGPLPIFENFCELYKYSEAIDELLFDKDIQPLVIIIADNMNEGVARANNLTKNRRLIPKWKRENLDHSQRILYNFVMKQFYLFKYLNTYYFVYPMNILNDLLTIYWQRKLISDYSDVTFNFVNVMKNSSFKDITIPVESNLACINCNLVEYVREKLTKGESFAELFELRKLLFSEEATKDFSFINFDTIPIDRYSYFQRESFMMHVNMLLKQIKPTSSLQVDRSLKCFEPPNSTIENDISNFDMSKMREILILSDYLQSVYENISSFSSSESSLEHFCNSVPMLELMKFPCFVNDLSATTVHNSEAYGNSLKQFVNESLINERLWLKELVQVYKDFNNLDKEEISQKMDKLGNEMQAVEKNYKHLMQQAYTTVNLTIAQEQERPISIFEDFCELYHYSEAIDDLLFREEFKPLFIIVTDDMERVILGIKEFTNRVLPKVNRENLHYSQQFLYDIILRNFFMFKSKDIYYYVNPTNMQADVLRVYWQNVIMRDYTQTVIHFLKFSFSKIFDIVIPVHSYLKCPESSISFDISSIDDSFVNLLNMGNKLFSYGLRIFEYVAHHLRNVSDLEDFNYTCLKLDGIRSSIKHMNVFIEPDPIRFKINCFPSLSLEGAKHEISFSVTNLKDAFVVFDLIQSIQNTIVSLNAQDYYSKDFQTICRGKHNFEFIKLFCFIKTVVHKKYSTMETVDHFLEYITESAISSINTFAYEFLSTTQDLSERLLSVYKNVEELDEIKIVGELQALYNKIPNINTKNRSFFKKIIFIVRKNIIMFLEGNIMCFPLENGKYKLEVKTNVLRLNEIFHQAYCRGEIQLIELFALEKIIFDNDLNGYGKEMQVSIIAPIWEVVSNVTVNLSGIKTRNETSNKSGGIFYGIFNTLLVNSEHHLIIDVTGGNAKFFSFIGFSKPEFINRLDIRDSNNITHEMIDLPAPKEPIIFYQFPEVFIKYKKFVLSSMLKNKNSNSKFLYTNLSMNKDILIDYTTINIVEELWDLENYYSAESDKSFSLSMLKVYKQEVLDYFRKHTESISKSMRVIDHLNTFYSRKIQNLEDKFYKNPILHIKDYLTHILSDSENLRNTEIQNRLHIITKDFTVQFDKEIIEAESLIKNNLEVDLQNNIDNLNGDMKKLILEVDDFIEKKESEIKTLEEQKSQLKRDMALTIMFGILKSVCIAMALINPVCAVAGAVIMVGIGIVESEIITSPVPVTQIKIPSTVTTKSNTAVNITLPSKYLGTLRGKITNYNTDKLKEIDFLKKAISELENERSSMKKNYDDTEMLDSAVDKLKKTCFNNPSPADCAKKNLIPKDLTKIERKHFKQMKAMNKVSTICDIAENGYETYVKARKINSQINQDDDKIQEARNDIKNLKIFKEKVNEQLKPQIEVMRNVLNGVTEGLATSPTTTFLDFQKWRMDDYLSDVLKQLESWTKKFEVEDDIRETMIKIKSALQTTIHFHTLIKEFQSKIKNAQYLEEVAATPFQQIFIEDPTLRKAYERLSYSYYANEVLDEYNKWLISFKQYTFPFIKNYPEIDESPFTTFSTPLIKANVAVQNMKSIRSYLNKIEAHGYSVFTNITTANFEDNKIYQHFYQWDSTRNYTAIKDILNGKEVKLVANIFEKRNFNAVKFSNVQLLISTTSTDPREERKLKRDLNKLLITLTHNGDSYYRCDDKVYLIESGIISFRFNFLKSKRRVIKADYVLSPYATWTIQLNNVLRTIPFNSLVKYANTLKIELVGEGQYLELNDNVCQDDLTKYYGNDIKVLQNY